MFALPCSTRFPLFRYISLLKVIVGGPQTIVTSPILSLGSLQIAVKNPGLKCLEFQLIVANRRNIKELPLRKDLKFWCEASPTREFNIIQPLVLNSFWGCGPLHVWFFFCRSWANNNQILHRWPQAWKIPLRYSDVQFRQRYEVFATVVRTEGLPSLLVASCSLQRVFLQYI